MVHLYKCVLYGYVAFYKTIKKILNTEPRLKLGLRLVKGLKTHNGDFNDMVPSLMRAPLILFRNLWCEIMKAIVIFLFR